MLPSSLLSLALFGITPYVRATTFYDFVIIGGGPSGLTLANRLTEDGTKNVLVLEAGQSHLDDPRILIPGNLGGTLNDPDYDWKFTTVPQTNANNRVIGWSRGKVLGGSTAINFMAYGRPASGEIDAIAQLGNPGWTWTDLFKYIKKSETFTPPSAEEVSQNNFTYIPENHGTTGPVKNSFSKFVSGGQVAWTTALKILGIPTLIDALGGADVGAWYAPASIDATSTTRSYATTAYYLPAADRPNLRLVTGAEASRIIITTSGGTATATGIEYFANGMISTVAIKHGAEVILSAGAVNSPKLLELSGIGDPSVLVSHDIPVNVNLPGVGNNMVDQVFLGASYELKDNTTVTLDSLADPIFAAQALAEYQANKTGIFTVGVTAYALLPLQKLTDIIHAAKLIAAQKLEALTGGYSVVTQKLWEIQFKQLLDPTQYGLVELVAFPGFFTTASAPVPGKKYVTFTVDYQFPFSRGSTHISSTNYTEQPIINPHYLTQDFDLQVLLEGLKFVRKLAVTGHFSDLIAAEADPGVAVSTDEHLITYIKNNVGTEYHTIGTCAMMPRDMGGVVSPQLKVYGTSNIRVIDLSILPLQISAHPQSTVYGIAEKAADIIRGLRTV